MNNLQFLSNLTQPANNERLNQKIPPILSFSTRYSQFKNQQNQLKRNEPTIQQPTEPSASSIKIKWGEPTWFLFHTLAKKVKEESFPQIRVELINKIVAICNNLPCPACAKHATEYMNKINFSTIQTKQNLIDLLFTFHNVVNAKKNYPIFPYSELEDKYSKAVTVNIIQHFFALFQDKNYNVLMISNNMHRKQLINTLKSWFRENLQYFDA